MRPHHVTLIAALALAATAPRSTAAQQPALASCTYDTCALRAEPRFLAVALVRGTTGVTVANLGLFGPNLERIVQGADSAVRHARQYRRSQIRGGAAGLAGSALTVVALLQCDDYRVFSAGNCPSSATPLFLGGVALGLYGGFELSRANRALSRAVWWYNRALPR